MIEDFFVLKKLLCDQIPTGEGHLQHHLHCLQLSLP